MHDLRILILSASPWWSDFDLKLCHSAWSQNIDFVCLTLMIKFWSQSLPIPPSLSNFDVFILVLPSAPHLLNFLSLSSSCLPFCNGEILNLLQLFYLSHLNGQILKLLYVLLVHPQRSIVYLITLVLLVTNDGQMLILSYLTGFINFDDWKCNSTCHTL